jgi:hypothetical protein
MSIELKIKSKHLSLEAQVIRFEENKLKKQIEWCKNRQDDTALRNTWQSLNTHRRWDVRNENRATYLARAFISGRAYTDIEKKRNDLGVFNCYIVPRVVSMVIKYKLKRLEKYMKLEDVKAVTAEIQEWSKLD